MLHKYKLIYKRIENEATNTNYESIAIDFVVHRGRTIPTLASMQEPIAAARYRQSKERSNMDMKGDDRGKRFFANFILLCICFIAI